jgi:long-chain acyl-CoA synthetase
MSSNRNKPWLENYDSEVPSNLHYPEIAVPDILIESAREFPEKIALVQGERTISYSKLLYESQQVGIYLINQGLLTGDRVALCMQNSIEFVVGYYGILLAGGVVAALNPTYPVRELELQVSITKPSFFIGSNATVNKLEMLEHEFRRMLQIKEIEQSTAISFSIQSVQPETNGENEKEPVPSLPEILPNHGAVLQFTGGTTGVPKAAVGLHRNIVANVLQFSTWLTGLRKGEEVFLTAIPLYHVYGMVIGLNVGINFGATIVLIENPGEPGKLVEMGEDHKVTVFPGVPALFNQISKFLIDNNRQKGLSSLKVCISGSAPLPAKTKDMFESLTGSKLVEGYGLSEAPTATHCNPIKGDNRIGSIGLPLPDVDCKIVSLEEKRISMKHGQIGELVICGPQIMAGYFEKDEETRLALESGWLYTGDIAWMDEDGFFYIVGRKKELIKVGGLQVWPSEIEEIVRQLPGISDCAVKGIPDDELGEIVKVWVVADNTEKITLETIQSYCEDKLATYKIPRQLEIIDALPRSFIGKLLRYRL